LDLAHIAYISKPHGVKGLLVLKEEHEFLYGDLKVIFIDMPTGRAPYFIKSLKPANNGLIVSLEDVDTVDQARLLVGKKVFADASFLVEEDNFTWVGFELIDKNYGSLGQVFAETDNGQHTLLNLTFRGKEVILPLVDEFIEKLDEPNKKIYYNAPEGLIEVYLEEGI
jgi:16S rRNA processing protein RimM